MVAPGICHVKAHLVDLIGSSGIENATSAQPKNLASAPRLSPLPFFGGVAGDETNPNPGGGGGGGGICIDRCIIYYAVTLGGVA